GAGDSRKTPLSSHCRIGILHGDLVSDGLAVAALPGQPAGCTRLQRIGPPDAAALPAAAARPRDCFGCADSKMALGRSPVWDLAPGRRGGAGVFHPFYRGSV